MDAKVLASESVGNRVIGETTYEVYDIDNKKVILSTHSWAVADAYMMDQGAIRPQGMDDTERITHCLYKVGDESGLTNYILEV